MAPNPFVSGHTNTYMFETTEDVDGLEAYVYVADETGTNIEYMPATTSPLHALSTELGATFYISYYERVKVDSESGTTLDRDLDITVYATFPNFYAAAAGNYGLLYLTDGAHFPSETTYSGTLFDLANGLDVNVTAIKTTSVDTAMPGPDNTTVDPTTATHLLTNTGFAVNTDMVVGVDNDGNPVVATIDLNADGSLVAPANMFVNRSSHQVGSAETGFANTFPHSYTNTTAPAFFPNPFNSNYNSLTVNNLVFDNISMLRAEGQSFYRSCGGDWRDDVTVRRTSVNFEYPTYMSTTTSYCNWYKPVFENWTYEQSDIRLNTPGSWTTASATNPAYFSGRFTDTTVELASSSNWVSRFSFFSFDKERNDSRNTSMDLSSILSKPLIKIKASSLL